MSMNVLAPSGRWSLPALALSVILAGGAATSLVRHHDDGLPAGVAFQIGARDVTVGELDQRINTLTALYSLKKPTDPAALETFRRDAAKSMAVSIILAGEAANLDIVVSAADAQSGLDRVIQQSLGGDTSKFTKFLGDSGISQDDVLAEVSRTLATSQLYSSVTKDVVAPTDAEARADYDSHRADMVSPEQRTLSNIVVATKAEAQRILARLRGGESFTALARSSSLDSSTRDKGGDLGTHAAADMDAAYAKVAFAARKGAVFGPVSTGANAWNVGRVDAVVPSKQLTFEQVRATLVNALKSREQLKVWNAWLSRVIKKAGVVYADKYRPAHPDEAPSLDQQQGTTP